MHTLYEKASSFNGGRGKYSELYQRVTSYSTFLLTESQ
jgi:hypothetical protein